MPDIETPTEAGTDAIAISLVSHTNVGKTTLARTLLGRDVGEVRDDAHVTEFADVHTMLLTPQKEALQLWDTPGFGDSVRLVRRLRQAGNPVGWFMTEVWDRWSDKAFWFSQQAVRNVQDKADVVLYLVNAAEEPAASGYVNAEMELLEWVGKPVIVLVNQLGPPREASWEQAEVERWRQHLAAHGHVARVLPMDAFARCWVQEFTLLKAIEDALPAERRALMARLRAAWQTQRLATFDASMLALAQSLARIAAARQRVPEAAGVRARVREVGAALGMGRADQTQTAAAQAALAVQLQADLADNTAQLIHLHGLEGDAQGEILSRLATHYETRLKLGEGKAAMLGGMLTGALAGLKADVAAGGLTLGGGMIAGSVLGALGGAGLARCYNLVRGTEHSWLAWNAEALNEMVEAALLRYLAVAHFGRGRGQWAQSETPAHWRDVVAQALAPYADALDELWRGRSHRAEQAVDPARLERDLLPLLTQVAGDALHILYPHAPPVPAPTADRNRTDP